MARIKNDYDFLAGIYVADGLYFNKYRMVLDLKSISVVPEDQNIAFDRIDYFLHEIVQSSVFVAEDEHEVIAKYKSAGIPVLAIPSPGPYDQVVQAIIATKINAILEEVLELTDSEISSLAGGYVSYLWGNEDYEDEIHEFINSDHAENWWATPEPRFTSLSKLESDNTAFIEMSWEHLKLQWYDESEDPTANIATTFPSEELSDDESDNDTETIIKMSDFKA